MNKKYFALKLLPCRPDLAETMTAERNIMQQHIVYMKEYMDKGIMLVFGPVLDPNGVYGLGIIAVDSEEQVSELIDKGPTSAINKHEYYPMMALFLKNKSCFINSTHSVSCLAILIQLREIFTNIFSTK